MANNFFKIKKGTNLDPQTGSVVTAEGDIAFNDTSKKLEIHDGTTADSVVEETKAATLTNKSIDGNTNTLTNITATSFSGQLGVANGGTGRATLTAHSVLVGEGTAAIAQVAPGTAGVALVSTGAATDPAFGPVSLTAGVSGILPSTNGGTGVTSTATYPASGVIVTEAAVETLSNKSFSDAITMAEITTPATPSAGFDKIYPKADGNFYKLNSAGNEVQIGSGSGGTKNYLGTVNNINGNGNFELGATTGWSLFNTTLTGTLPTGTITAGAASITTFAATATSPLAGTYSLSVASSGAITAGQGFISQAFTLDSEDKAKVLANKFYYNVLTGATNLNFSGTSSNTWAVYIYDVTNAAWIQPAGVYNLVQNSGAGISTGTFQTTSNSTQYRLAVICINASAGASSMLFDDFFLGPQITAAGAAASDWTPFSVTITGSSSNPTKGTVAIDQGYWRRIGDSAQIRYNYSQTAAGSAGSGAYLYSLPPGLVIDSTKITTVGQNAVSAVGAWSGFDGSLTYTGTVQVGSTNQVQLAFGDYSVGQPSVASNFLPLSTAVVRYSFECTVPIAGLSSNTVMSNDTDTRVVGALYNIPTATITSTFSLVKFGTLVTDTHSSYSPSTGIYTIPVSGNYNISSGLSILATYTLGSTASVALYKNGSVLFRGDQSAGGAQGELYPSLTVNSIPFIAGDQISIQVKTTGSSATFDSNILNFLSINRLSGPATIAATDTVSMKYNSSTTAVGTSTAAVVYTSKEWDTHNAYNTTTGLYTIPVSGKYRINGAVSSASNAATTSASSNYLYGRKNQQSNTNNPNINMIATFLYQVSGVSFSPIMTGGSTEFNCVAGDTLDIAALRDAGVNSWSAQADARYNWIIIERVGN